MRRPVRWYWALLASCAAFFLVVTITDRAFWGAATDPYGPLGAWIPGFSDLCNDVLGGDYGYTTPATVTDVPAFLAGVAIWAWLRPARILANYPSCPACHYNLTGNVSGRCPECGTPVASPPQTKPNA